MKIKFREVKFSKRIAAELEQINGIIEDYKKQGYKMTLRQLYYQLVSRNVIANKQNEYKKLSRVLTSGRMAGIVDWDAIEDRLRVPSRPYWVNGVNSALEDAHDTYRIDRQKNQSVYVEVWVEKDAISNVLKRVTEEYGIRILVNRGYGSATAIKDVYDRINYQINRGATQAVVLYLGDHDPSGLDMIRDINSRVKEMLKETGRDQDFYIEPIALDALPPEVLDKVLREAIESEISMETYHKVLKEEKQDKTRLRNIIDNI